MTDDEKAIVLESLAARRKTYMGWITLTGATQPEKNIAKSKVKLIDGATRAVKKMKTEKGHSK